MDLARHPLACRAQSKIRKVLSRIQKSGRRATLPPETLRPLRGLGLLLIATLLGALSLQLTEQTSIIEYRASHGIPEVAWIGLLHHFGFEHHHEPLSAAQESGQPAIRVNGDGSEVILSLNQKAEVSGRWSRLSRDASAVNEWKTLPAGIDGFEALCQWLQIKGNLKSKGKSKAKSIDPMELHY